MRLFLALNFTQRFRTGIWEGLAGLRRDFDALRWVPEANYHLTLQFIGNVESDRADEIGARIATVAPGHAPIDVELGDLGTFPPRGKPRVVWVGCEGGPKLELLQNDVVEVLTQLGFEPDGKPFRPHVTLARARRGAGNVDSQRLREALAGLELFGSDVVSSVELMSSTPSNQGATYDPVRSIPLEG